MNAEKILEACQYGASISDLTHMLEQHSKEIFALGRKAGLKEAALQAQSFEIAHCKSSLDNIVDKTAYDIKEAISQRIEG